MTSDEVDRLEMLLTRAAIWDPENGGSGLIVGLPTTASMCRFYTESAARFQFVWVNEQLTTPEGERQ